MKKIILSVAALAAFSISAFAEPTPISNEVFKTKNVACYFDFSAGLCKCDTVFTADIWISAGQNPEYQRKSIEVESIDNDKGYQVKRFHKNGKDDYMYVFDTKENCNAIIKKYKIDQD